MLALVVSEDELRKMTEGINTLMSLVGGHVDLLRPISKAVSVSVLVVLGPSIIKETMQAMYSSLVPSLLMWARHMSDILEG